MCKAERRMKVGLRSSQARRINGNKNILQRSMNREKMPVF